MRGTGGLQPTGMTTHKNVKHLKNFSKVFQIFYFSIF